MYIVVQRTIETALAENRTLRCEVSSIINVVENVYFVSATIFRWRFWSCHFLPRKAPEVHGNVLLDIKSWLCPLWHCFVCPVQLRGVYKMLVY